MVDEGVSVTILCNITNGNIPPGAKNIRYQWHNPNGTLVSNQWFLRIANIQIYESGVYVCTVSVDVDGTTHEASRGTNVQVKQGKSYRYECYCPFLRFARDILPFFLLAII